MGMDRGSVATSVVHFARLQSPALTRSIGDSGSGQQALSTGGDWCMPSDACYRSLRRVPRPMLMLVSTADDHPRRWPRTTRRMTRRPTFELFDASTSGRRRTDFRTVQQLLQLALPPFCRGSWRRTLIDGWPNRIQWPSHQTRVSATDAEAEHNQFCTSDRVMVAVRTVMWTSL